MPCFLKTVHGQEIDIKIKQGGGGAKLAED